MDTAVAYAPDTAREMIEGHYVKLRIEWEKARREPPPGEEEGEEGETVASEEPGGLSNLFKARKLPGADASGA
jgi:hypothetical protein